MTQRFGIVVVSHSAALAAAMVELATELVAEHSAPIAVAAGMPDGGLGTDATAVMEAIEEVASPAGVLVLMDLGSAVMSTELAVELLGDLGMPLRLTWAPVVEGLVVAVQQSSDGSDLDAVVHEVERALEAKVSRPGGAVGAART